MHYTYYNEKYGKDGIHETLDWDESNDEVEKFYKDYILQDIIDTEVSQQVYPFALTNLYIFFISQKGLYLI